MKAFHFFNVKMSEHSVSLDVRFVNHIQRGVVDWIKQSF